ncbi:hypothetical protein FKP32DRAFT_230306 [Trametes sanguinea]|nr:hypothetical protein FKP32DRAFT_230306 [Trametes sanguinea]
MPALLSLSLAPSIGAILLSTFICLVLCGVSIHQFFLYMRQFPSDRMVIKGLVIVVMIINVIHTVAPMHACFHYLVTTHAYERKSRSHVTLNKVLSKAWLISASECFFAYRVYLIGFKSKCIACIAVACLLAGNAVCIATTMKGFEIRTLPEFTEKTRGLTVAYLALGATGDFLLSCTIFVSLYRSRANHARSSVLGVLILYVLNTGLLNSTMQGVSTVTAIVYPAALYYAAIALLFVSRGIRIFNDQPFGREIISRANRLATVERWNVPQVQDDMMPPVINVKVVAEIEVHGRSDTDSSSDYDPKPLPPVGHGS